jgi:hypothetical protein
MKVLKCSQCGHENDLTRVFCQDCGARLDRMEVDASKGPAAPPLVTAGPGKSFKPIKIRKAGGGGLGWLKSLIILVIWAAIIAAVIQAVRPPDDAPPATAANVAQGAVLENMLRTSSFSPTPVTYGATPDAINGLLSSKLKSGGESSGITPEFKRVYVATGDKTLKVGLEQTIATWPVFVVFEGVPVKSGDKWVLKPVGGRIGRLPIPAPLSPYIERFFAPVSEALNTQLAYLNNANSIEVTSGQVVLSWPGQGR